MPCKNTLRQQAQQQRKSLSIQQKMQASQAIQETLLNQLQQLLPQQGQVLAYRHTANEVATDALFFPPAPYAWQLYAPQVREHRMQWLHVDAQTQWQTGQFNILEPQSEQLWQAGQQPSVLICPLVGFDLQGNRLGMGMGFFDQWLEHHRQHLDIVIGLAFACQQVSAIPFEAHDIPMDAVITENGWVACQKH